MLRFCLFQNITNLSLFFLVLTPKYYLSSIPPFPSFTLSSLPSSHHLYFSLISFSFSLICFLFPILHSSFTSFFSSLLLSHLFTYEYFILLHSPSLSFTRSLLDRLSVSLCVSLFPPPSLPHTLTQLSIAARDFHSSTGLYADVHTCRGLRFTCPELSRHGREVIPGEERNTYQGSKGKNIAWTIHARSLNKNCPSRILELEKVRKQWRLHVYFTIFLCLLYSCDVTVYLLLFSSCVCG